MTLTLALQLYGVALALFLIIDLVWIGVAANGVYRRMYGSLMRERPNVPVALMFYALFIVGLVYFAIAPAVDGGGLSDALLDGALFGLFTYATFDLTSYAVIRGFPGAIVAIDIAWGVVLCASISSGTWWIAEVLL